MSHVLS